MRATIGIYEHPDFSSSSDSFKYNSTFSRPALYYVALAALTLTAASIAAVCRFTNVATVKPLSSFVRCEDVVIRLSPAIVNRGPWSASCLAIHDVMTARLSYLRAWGSDERMYEVCLHWDLTGIVRLYNTLVDHLYYHYYGIDFLARTARHVILSRRAHERASERE
jgi:hypothetical protein